MPILTFTSIALVCVLSVLLWRAFQRCKYLEAHYGQIADVDAEIRNRRAAANDEIVAEKRETEDSRKRADAEIASLRLKTEFDLRELSAMTHAELEKKKQIVESELHQKWERAKADLAEVVGTLQRTKQQANDFLASHEQKRLDLEREYEKAIETHRKLTKEISLLEENLEDISFGLYKPHFSFQTSEEYKAALEQIRNEQRQMIRDKQAATCAVTWHIENDLKAGERMKNQYLKLMLRAFNGECDAAVANVAWNNVTRMEARLQKSFDALNELGGVMKMQISPRYAGSRLTELRLAHEYEQKRYEEREEQRKIREQIREEEKAQRELDRAREEAESEEQRFQKALAQARAEAAKAAGAQLERLTEQVSSFEAKLDEARRKKERAIARAQLTKSGFVYVISNHGSFGEKIVKIGMTRRLEPMERIQELGDASVPFPFDLHVMLYSDNAPELECALHALFATKRVNLVNSRKEFYRDVRLEDIEAFVRQRGLSAQFIHIPEAREYRETLAALADLNATAAPTVNRFSPLFNSASA
jgi:F0F1-type ATP synthase membrane subunit b/b'